MSAVSFEKCHPAKPRLLHARLRLSARVMPISLHHTLKMRRGTSCNRPSGSTIESTGTGCSTAAMTSERRADETQVVTGCARGPDKGSSLGLGKLGAAHSPDKTLPSRSGSGGRAPSRSGFFALYHPSEPSPAQPEQNLPRENPWHRLRTRRVLRVAAAAALVQLVGDQHRPRIEISRVVSTALLQQSKKT